MAKRKTKTPTDIQIDRSQFSTREEYHKEYSRLYREKNRDYYRSYQLTHKVAARRNDILRYALEKMGIKSVDSEIQTLQKELKAIRKKNLNLLQKIKNILDREVEIKMKLKLNKRTKNENENKR